ncbi:MAG: aryl-sulfate sulfotransferase [bacterium]
MLEIYWTNARVMIKNHQIKIYILVLLALFNFSNLEVRADYWQVTTLNEPSAGYLKMDVESGGNFYLLDNYGTMQHVDSSDEIQDCLRWKQLRNGNWSCSKDRSFKIFNDNFQLLQTINFVTEYDTDDHDIEVLDNGNYLLLCNETRKMDLSEIVDGGQSDAEVFGVVLVEIDYTGTIFWVWNGLDHFDILDATPDVDLTMNNIDFTHTNSIAVDLDGNILISSRNLDEITKINKATGAIMWRWGGSECRNNQFSFTNDNINGFSGFSHQHAITVLSNGHYLLYDNGNLKPQPYSRGVEYSLNIPAKTATKVWEYRHSPDLSIEYMGNVQRLSDGNSLINWGMDLITEVNSSNNVRFELTHGNFAYRVYKILIHMNAMSRNVSGTGLYDFNGGNKERTKVNININSYAGSGSLKVEKHDYSPPTSSFSDTNFTSILPYRWVLSKNGITSINGNLRIKVSELNGINEPSTISLFKRDGEARGTFVEINTSYNSANGEISADINGFGEIIMCSYKLENVSLSTPSNNKVGVNTNGILTWQKIKGAKNYKIQISDDSGFNNIIKNEIVGNVSETNYADLNFNTRYYWRVSAMNSKDTSDWSVNSFTTTLQPPVLISPENSKIGVPLLTYLIWSKVNGSTKYWVQIARDSLFANIVDQSFGASDTIKLISLPMNYTDYYWRVSAYRSTDTSMWSEIRNFKTKLGYPEITFPKKGSYNIDTAGTITWTDISGAETYNLQVAKDSLFNKKFIEEYHINKNENDFKNADFNQTYFCRIRSVNSIDSSDWSKVTDFTTFLKSINPLIPIDKTTDLDTTFTFFWEESSDPCFYTIEISKDIEFSQRVFYEDSLIFSNCNVNGLPSETTLYWRVRIEIGEKQSKWSKVFSFKTMKIVPLTPPELINPSNSAEDYSISGYYIWKYVPGANEYSLEVSLDSLFNNIIESRKINSDTTAFFEKYKYNNQYFWRVKAYNSYDSSDWSEVWNFTTADETTYPETQLLEPSNASTKIKIKGTFKWLKEQLVKKYHLQLSEDENFSSCLYNLNDITNDYFEYDSLDFNKKYFWRVGAEFNNLSIKWSEKRWFITELNVPSIILPEHNSSAIPKTGLLQWTEESGATGYDIRLSDDTFFSNIILDIKNNSTNEYPYDLSDSLTYYWMVKAVNDTNESQWSSVYKFATSSSIDVFDNLVIDNLRINPNPVHNYATLHFSIEKNSIITLRIIDLLGMELYKQKLGYISKGRITYNLDLNFLNDGFYFLLIDEGWNTRTLKLIKR